MLYTLLSQKEVFRDIALLFASYLDHLDLVLSDFIAGMMLLRQQQKALFDETINQVIVVGTYGGILFHLVNEMMFEETHNYPYSR